MPVVCRGARQLQTAGRLNEKQADIFPAKPVPLLRWSYNENTFFRDIFIAYRCNGGLRRCSTALA
jgi:hypothetical protein